MNTQNLLAAATPSNVAPTSDTGMHPFDLTVIILYAIGIVALGIYAGLKSNKKATPGNQADNYFLAGNSLKWPVIGLALFATNISTVHIIGLAEAGFKSGKGLTEGNFELMAGLCLAILAVFFAPFFIRSKVSTLPDFLEKRYSRGSRDLLTVLSIFSAVLIHIGFTLYTGAVVINGLFGIELNLTVSILIIAALTGVYTIIGGLTAVVVTESIQTIIMLLGTILITVIGYNMAGGWESIKASVPSEQLTMFADDYQGSDKLRWFTFIPGYFVIGIWYWCTDQTIVQRVLAAKDENQARLGALFAGFLKLLPLFIIVLPGVIFLSLVNQGIVSTDENFKASETYLSLIKEVLPIGLKGLLAATLLSAVMSTVSGSLNSIATLVSFDLLKRRNPDATDKSLVLAGRITASIALLLAIIWSSSMNPDGIFTEMQGIVVNVAPPITTVFLLGVFWKKASAKASLLTLIIGSLVGLILFLTGQNFFFNQEEVTIATDYNNFLATNYLDYMLVGIMHFAICVGIMIIGSHIYPHKHTAESSQLTWNSPLEALQGKASPGLANYKFLTLLLITTVAAIYVWLW